MKIPLEFYDFLRNRLNLSDVVRQKVSLVRKAGEYTGLCPFHSEKTPSFTVNDAKRFYHCFGCGAHGDVVRFVSETNGLAYKEAAIKLAQDYGIELPKLTKAEEKIYEESDKIITILELAKEFFKSELSNEAICYLNKRGVSKQLIDEFDIGYAPAGGKLQKFFMNKPVAFESLVQAGLVGKKDDGRVYEFFHNRIMFPIRNVYNKIVGFGGRVIGDGLPKYLNSPETIIFKKNETLYGEHKAIAAAYKKNYSLLVEGYLDVIALHKSGFNYAVASLGTAVTEAHIEKLWRAGDEIILCLDGDAAGIRASQRVINLVLPLLTSEKKISFIQLPEKDDPDDIIEKKGAAFFQKLMDSRINLSEMIWQIEYLGKNFATAEARANLETTLEKYCKQIKDRKLNNNYYRYFKDQIWQHLVKRHSNGNNKYNQSQSLQLTQINNYSEFEIIEHALYSLLVKFPEIIKNEKVKEFLLTTPLQTSDLSDFRDWFFESFNEQSDLSMQILTEIVEKTRFYNTFLLLSKTDNPFLGKLLDKVGSVNCLLLWQLLHKNYYLVMLKHEYIAIMKSGSDDAYKKATLYQEEILRISKELQKLNESFIT